MIELVKPSEKMLKMFDMATKSLLDKLIANLDQNEKLTNIRDTLLPKLMSGELRVGDAA
jgi:type I restriction enzyme S subunit